MAIMLWSLPLCAQSYRDVIRPFYGMRGVSGAESGVLPVSRAQSNAVLGNPALLSYSERSFFSMDLSFDMIGGTSIYDSQKSDPEQFQRVRFNNISYIYPLRVYRGAWVWGFNIQPVQSFNSIQSFSGLDTDTGSDFEYSHLKRSTGNLYALSMATSFLWTRNTSLGFGASLLTGRNEYHDVYRDNDHLDVFLYNDYLDSTRVAPRYLGGAVRMGLTSEVADNVRAGVLIGFPSRISVAEASSQSEIETYDDGTETVLYEDHIDRLEYSIWGPWELGLGIGFIVDPLSVSINYKYYSYSTSSMSSDLLSGSGQDLDPIVADDISTYVQDVHEYSAAVNWSVLPLDFSLGASIKNSPIVENSDRILRLDMGIGYQLHRNVGITFATRTLSWQSDLDHELFSGDTRIVGVENTFTQMQLGVKYILD